MMYHNNEFGVIAKHILGVDGPPEELLLSYQEAISVLNCDLNDYEARVWSRMLGNRFLFGLYDSGFSWLHPESNLKKRIFIGLALLESNHHYHKYFLDETPAKDFFKLLFLLPYALFQSFFGALLVYFRI